MFRISLKRSQEEIKDYKIVPREKSLELGIERQTGLSADSKGVKFTSPFRVRVDRCIRVIKLKASWKAFPADSITEVRVVGEKTGTIASISGNEVTDGESEGQTFADGELVYIEVEVKKVSSTVGATVDLEYVVLELIYDRGGDE